MAKEAGLIKLGHVSLDGTKLKANASKHKAMSYGRMVEHEKRLADEIKQLMNKAEEADEAEDAAYGPDRRGDELPAELANRQSRLAKIREAKAALEAQAKAKAEEEPKEQAQAPTNQPLIGNVSMTRHNQNPVTSGILPIQIPGS